MFVQCNVECLYVGPAWCVALRVEGGEGMSPWCVRAQCLRVDACAVQCWRGPPWGRHVLPAVPRNPSSRRYRASPGRLRSLADRKCRRDARPCVRGAILIPRSLQLPPQWTAMLLAFPEVTDFVFRGYFDCTLFCSHIVVPFGEQLETGKRVGNGTPSECDTKPN